MIPTTSSPSHHSKPGWNDNIKYLRDDALSWHYFWKMNSHPGTGYIAEMRRLSRATYHRAVRHLKRAETRMRTKKMAEALISNRSRDLWSEVKRMKGRSRKSACIIDGVNGDKDIADLFSDKYNTLYTSFPFDNDDMLRIRSTIDHRLQNTRCSGYVITPTYVRIAVDHLKSGKGDGFEGLCSDHFINGTKRL